MDKEQILEEINKTKEHLANMENMLAECEYERWKPKVDEIFWLVDSYVHAACTLCLNSSKECDDRLFNSYNCFKTREQAEQEAEKILIRRQLEDIAQRLNKGQKIDWDNIKQSKHCIELQYDDIITNFYTARKIQGTVYCLDENFKATAIQEIGEERLRKYLKGC